MKNEFGFDHPGSLLVAWLFALAGCAGRPPLRIVPTPSGSIPAGVLVMAHGGSSEWNAAVEAAVAPLAAQLPTEIAFGMAHPEALQRAVSDLESAGVRRIAVVRLFISGSSFLHATEFLLNKRPDAPTGWRARSDSGVPAPVRSKSEIEIDHAGLVEGLEVGSILRTRALALSHDPPSEAVLIIGHGNGDHGVNQRLAAGMDTLADSIRDLGFAEVGVETLREDWAESRAVAAARIRAWVAGHTVRGSRVIVLPLRLFGFGPYAQVLDGLEYAADGAGLLPHPAITDWLRSRARTVFCANAWQHTLGACPPPKRAVQTVG